MADNYCVTHGVRMNGNDYPRCTFGIERGEACEMRAADDGYQVLPCRCGHHHTYRCQQCDCGYPSKPAVSDRDSNDVTGVGYPGDNWPEST